MYGLFLTSDSFESVGAKLRQERRILTIHDLISDHFCIQNCPLNVHASLKGTIPNRSTFFFFVLNLDPHQNLMECSLAHVLTLHQSFFENILIAFA